MADLRIVDVTKRFGDTVAIERLNIDMASGEFVVLLGPSGAGKTTSLRLVAGLEPADAGQIWIDGRDVTTQAPALRDVTFVFQQYSLYPHLNVYDNLAFPLRSPLRNLNESQIRSKVLEIAQLLKMEDKLQNLATKLSGGQMQRVAIGRALVRNPAVYLMDEPLSSLDAKLRGDLRLELKRIHQDTAATMLYVTHDQIEALTLATRIGVLDQGRLVQLGTPRDVYENPASMVVASRLGTPRINFIPRALVARMPLPDSVKTIGVRAEQIQFCSDVLTPNVHLQSTVRRVEHLSDQFLLHLRVNDSEHDLIVAAPPNQAIERGGLINIHIAQCLWFDALGQRIRP